MNKWISPIPLQNKNNEVIREFGGFLGEILIRRGILNMEAAQSFFACKSLSDPFLMSDMSAAVDIINSALDEGKKITVFGDHDCDGVCSTAMMYSFLEAQGADVEYYIPSRDEGFGMSIPALEKIVNRGTELIITVDNGINAIAEADFLREKGVELIITDHHQPGASLPVCSACVDPNRADDPSPFKDLCGAGVALKLIIALMDGDEQFALEHYADLAAIATIGDVMPLKGENRYIVQLGLRSIADERHAGISALVGAAKLSARNITAVNLAFVVCPRINAAGRMDTTERALRLMLCEDDADTARRISEELCELNEKRKSSENAILKDIENQSCDNPLLLKQRVIVAAGEGWHHGIIGIIAARLVERYGKPAVVISIQNGIARGSVRSVEGFSVHKMLTECSRTLTKYGGHPGAGGFSLPAERLDEFTEDIYRYAREFYPKMPERHTAPDMELSLRDLTLDNVKKLSLLEPFGEGNSQPLFLLKGCTVKTKRALSDGKFTRFDVEQDGVTLGAVDFSTPFAKFFPKSGDKIDITATAEINEYNGRESVQLKPREYRPADFSQDRYFAALRTYEELCRSEPIDPRLGKRIIPQSREELMKIYDIVRAHNGAMTPEEIAVYDGSVNLCMLLVTLDAFAEAGMIEYATGGEPKTVPVEGKRDLFAAGLLADLKSRFFDN